MKLIPLTKGFYTMVDDDDYEKFSKYKWQACYTKNGHIRPKRRAWSKDKSRLQTVNLPREIMNAPLGMEVDHINGDTLDNRKCNLRVCTRTQNIRNRGINRNNTNGYKGVRFVKKPECHRNPWHAVITVNWKKFYLGCFKTPEEAAAAYNKGAIKHFGKFARLNTIYDKK